MCLVTNLMRLNLKINGLIVKFINLNVKFKNVTDDLNCLKLSMVYETRVVFLFHKLNTPFAI